jgi:hypothetical protein
VLAKSTRYKGLLTVSKWNIMGYGGFTGDNLEKEQRISELRNQVEYCLTLPKVHS